MNPTNPPADDREVLARMIQQAHAVELESIHRLEHVKYDKLLSHAQLFWQRVAGRVLAAGFRRPVQAMIGVPPCIGGDPRCPCQDGDVCNYRDSGSTKAYPIPAKTADPPGTAECEAILGRRPLLDYEPLVPYVQPIYATTHVGDPPEQCGPGGGCGGMLGVNPWPDAMPITEPPQDDVVAVARVLADVAQESYLLGANRVLAMLRERGWKPASEQTNEDWIYPDDVIAKAFEARTRLGLSFESPSLEHAAPHEISGVVRAALAATPPRGPRDESPLGAKLREHRRKIVESGTRLLTEEEVMRAVGQGQGRRHR